MLGSKELKKRKVKQYKCLKKTKTGYGSRWLLIDNEGIMQERVQLKRWIITDIRYKLRLRHGSKLHFTVTLGPLLGLQCCRSTLQDPFIVIMNEVIGYNN